MSLSAVIIESALLAIAIPAMRISMTLTDLPIAESLDAISLEIIGRFQVNY